jgi:hypothetical protein
MGLVSSPPQLESRTATKRRTSRWRPGIAEPPG